MKRILASRFLFDRMANWFDSDRHMTGLLFTVTLFVYGIFVPWLGFYGDDWSKIFLLYHHRDISIFFAGNRPWLSPIYTFLGNLLAAKPWQWQSVLLLLRFVNAWLVYRLVREIRSTAKQRAGWIALLTLVYPGFLISFQPLTFFFHYIQSACFFLSLWLTARLMKKPLYGGRFFEWIMSILLGGISLVLSEYFYFLELMRYSIAWLALEEMSSQQTPAGKKKIFAIFLSYVIMFAFVSVWRWFVQTNISRLGTDKMYALFRNPAAWLSGLVTMLKDGIFNAGLQAWIVPSLRYVMDFSLITGVVILVGSIVFQNTVKKKNSPHSQMHLSDWHFIVFGCIWCAVAIIPFWLAGLEMSLSMEAQNRFLMPVAFGSACVIWGIVSLFKSTIWRTAILTWLAVQASILQVWAGNQFRLAWVEQDEFFSQMTARIPMVKPGTLFLFNAIPLWMQSENSISSMLNILYAHQNRPGEIDVYAYYDQDRFATEVLYPNSTEASSKHLIGTFLPVEGQILLFDLNLSGCMQLTDNAANFPGWQIGKIIPKEAIISDGTDQRIEERLRLYFSEKIGSFCVSYQQAVYAASNGDWQRAVKLGEEALHEGFNSQYALEWELFIKANLRIGDTSKAILFSHILTESDRSRSKNICALWREFPDLISQEQVQAFLYNELFCSLDLQP